VQNISVFEKAVIKDYRYVGEFDLGEDADWFARNAGSGADGGASPLRAERRAGGDSFIPFPISGLGENLRCGDGPLATPPMPFYLAIIGSITGAECQ